MIETFFKRSCTIHGLREGALAGHIDLLADPLAAHGFSLLWNQPHIGPHHCFADRFRIVRSVLGPLSFYQANSPRLLSSEWQLSHVSVVIPLRGS